MAGAFVQSWSNGVTTQGSAVTCTVSGATANNLLVCVFASDGAWTGSTSMTGWTLVEDTFATGSASGAVFYRIASGDTNDNISYTLSTKRKWAVLVNEYSGLDSSSPLETSDENVTYITSEQTGGSSLNCGSATPSTANGTGIATFHGDDERDYSSTELSIDDSFTKDAFYSAGAGQIPVACIASLNYTSTTALSPDWSSSKGANYAGYATIATYKDASASSEDDLLADNVESASELSSPAIGQEHDLSADNVESASELSTPTLAEADTEDDLLADNVESASELTTPSLEQIHALLAENVESASELTSPALEETHALTADNVESASELTSPAITQEHVLLADNVESASELTSPTITQEHDLSADDVESASELTSPALSESNILLADNVESASELTSPEIGQEHSLTADNVESASEITTPTLEQEHTLLANNVESASELTAPTLADFANLDALLADNVESASEVSTPSIEQVHNLSANNIESASELTSPTFGQIQALLPDDLECASEVSTPTLTEQVAGVDALLAENLESASVLSIPTLDRQDETEDRPAGGWEPRQPPSKDEKDKTRRELGILPKKPHKRITAKDIPVSYESLTSLESTQLAKEYLERIKKYLLKVNRRGEAKRQREEEDRDTLRRILLALEVLADREQRIEEQDVVFCIIALTG